ncbi:peptide ligase PGM1-related protein [Streptomyces sp. NPDC059582]|uniref:preATP grasp domain-containing protein n=1 Tax=Streptomyces sp. NPDC059582 TaxID=3346875 RepID=UPI0036B70958
MSEHSWRAGDRSHTAAEHGERAPLVILANFVSPLAVDLSERSVLRGWSEQAARKLWLTRPGDVLITPAPLSDAFRRYAFERLGIPDGSVTVVTVPDAPLLPTAQALAAHGLLEPLRALVRERPGACLLPTALDAASVALAGELGVPVVPYETSPPPPATVKAVARLNTKSGFRAVAHELGIRLPYGRVCTGAELFRVTDEVLSVHERVVVKPDRSAGGHGLYFVTRDDRTSQPMPSVDTHWVVEQYVGHTTAVSAQGYVTAGGADVLYDGEMRMSGGSFVGYRSPLDDLSDLTRAELADWTRVLGRHLGAEGYRGPYSLDAVRAQDGTLHALECNVRRTATTTAHALVTRLVHGGRPVWSTGVAGASLPSFDSVLARLTGSCLDFRPADGEGVLLYTDRPVNGSGWRYVAIAADHSRLASLEGRLAATLKPAVL